jgi:hypothetical protein
MNRIRVERLCLTLRSMQHDPLNITPAEAEAVIEPYRMPDDLGNTAEVLVGVGRRRHGEQAATPGTGMPT